MFAVEIDPGTIERSQSGSITGTIWLKIEAAEFPERTWNDFVVVILGWWANEAAELVAGTKTRGEFMFMDGPFSVSIAADGESWQLDCNRRRRDGLVREHRAKAAATDIANSLVRSADAVIALCKRNAWQSSEIDELERGRAALAHAAGANLKAFVDPRL
jgi:hypothetical protein